MHYEVYCDESCIEALFDKDSHSVTVIGGIWIPADFREEIKKKLRFILDKYHRTEEFKWNKISPSTVEMYEELIQLFFNSYNIRFRAICIHSDQVDNARFNRGDGELGFYKFYYQLIHKWLIDDNSYSIFLDYKVNGNKHRVKDLERILRATSNAEVKQAQAIPSHQSLLIQFADVLTGAVSSSFNEENTSESKLRIRKLIEAFLGHRIRGTAPYEQKYNVFDISLRKGGW